MAVRVVRVYHAGRTAADRLRDRALASAGVDLTLVVPEHWPEPGSEPALPQEPFRVIELAVRRAGDVNRHTVADPAALQPLLDDARPDVLDLHEEPYSAIARQWLAAAPAELPVVMYTAQNLDKRFPPPYARYERAALARAAAIYPCSRQAAAVARGKGFGGIIDVIPLGYDDTLFHPGEQSLECGEITLMLAGRLVEEKGVLAAVDVLAHVSATRPARLVVVGEGPLEAGIRAHAASVGVGDRVELLAWQAPAALAALYRQAHVVLVPSRATHTWAEQFGRVIVEAQASGATVAGYASGAIAEVAGAAGITVAGEDAAELARRVAALVSDPTEFAQRREAGLRAVAERRWPVVAADQLALYRAAIANELPRLSLPRSPRARRRLATGEFGPSATAAGGVARPFVLPLLRAGGPLARALGAVIDAAAEAAARAGRG